MNQKCDEELVNIILGNEDLIYSLANRFSKYSSKEDLYQVGIIGIMSAYRNFDAKRGAKFSTYAYPYILGEMKKYIRENYGMKVSRDLIYLYSKIEHAKDLICQKLKRYPTTAELSLYLEIEEDKIIEAMQLNLFVKSLDEPINSEGKEITVKDSFFKEQTMDSLDLISLKEELLNLSSDEQQLFCARYLQDKTQQETAELMGVSQVQVSREEQKVLTKLRNKMYN